MKQIPLVHLSHIRKSILQWSKQKIYITVGILFVVILLISYLGYIIALDKVVLDVDSQHYEWQTLNWNVAGVLHEKGIVLNDSDVVKPALSTKVVEHLRIQVIRAFPVVIKTATSTKNYNTISQTVRDLLEQANIQYNHDDRVIPGLDSVVKPFQKIRIIKVTSSIITRREEVEPATEYRKDKELEKGAQQILRNGKPGLVERQIKIIYEDGNEVERYKISEKIIHPAVNEIVLMGIKPVVRTLVTSRGLYRYTEMKVMTATAYYPGPESCGKYAAFGETYTGKKAGFGLVAIDPRVIKLGTKLYIEGYGKAEAADIGGAIKGNKIDLCYETFREAAMYGVKKVKVYILLE